MLSLILLIVSMAAMIQFSVYYWRSLVAGVAAQPVPSRVCMAAGLEHDAPGAEDFGALLSLHRLTPGLEGRPAKLSALQVYYKAMNGVQSAVSNRMPAIQNWAKSEMALCSRYVAVMVGERLDRNLACATAMRSF
jgi:hypothetical protein